MKAHAKPHAEHKKVLAIFKSFTTIRTPEVIDAALLHLCDGFSVAEATERAGAKSRSTVNRACNKAYQTQELINDFEDHYKFVNIPAFLKHPHLTCVAGLEDRLAERFDMHASHTFTTMHECTVRIINSQNLNSFDLLFEDVLGEWQLAFDVDGEHYDQSDLEYQAAKYEALRYLKNI